MLEQSLRALLIVARALLVCFVGTMSAYAGTISQDQIGRAYAGQSGVYEVHRNIFRRGGHQWRWVSPNPYGDGYSYGDASLWFSVLDLIPEGSTVTSAVLSWEFRNLTAVTDSHRPQPGTELGGDHAKAPRIHGSGSYCGPCIPASLNNWGPSAAFWASRIELAGAGIYWFAGPPRASTGSIDLLSVYPTSSLLGRTIGFVGTVQYAMGRPFFGTEGWNADTEFDVWGHAMVDILATLTVGFTPPPAPIDLGRPPSDPDTAETPEPASLLLVGCGVTLITFSRFLARRRA